MIISIEWIELVEKFGIGFAAAAVRYFRGEVKRLNGLLEKRNDQIMKLAEKQGENDKNTILALERMVTKQGSVDSVIRDGINALKLELAELRSIIHSVRNEK